MAQRSKYRVQGTSFCQLQSDGAIARKRAGRGEDQVAGPGQPHDGLGAATQRHAQALNLRQTPCNERCARVLAQAHAIGNPHGNRQHVLHRTADFHAGHIGRVVDPEAPAMQCRCGGARESRVARSERQRARQPLGDLERERRPRQRAARRRLRAKYRFHDLVRQQPGAGLEPLAQPEEGHHSAARLQRPDDCAQARRRRRDHDQLR